MTPIQKIEMGAFAVAGFASALAPALAPRYPICAAFVGGLGAAAIGVKAYFSSSPKDKKENDQLPMTNDQLKTQKTES